MPPVTITESTAPVPGEQPVNGLVIALSKPVALGDQTYTELRLREPTGAEMIATDRKTGWELEVALIALVSGVPEPAVIKIGVRDLNRARKYLGGFFD